MKPIPQFCLVKENGKRTYKSDFLNFSNPVLSFTLLLRFRKHICIKLYSKRSRAKTTSKHIPSKYKLNFYA